MLQQGGGDAEEASVDEASVDAAAWEDIEEYLTFMQPHKHLRVLDDGSKEEVEHCTKGRAADVR